MLSQKVLPFAHTASPEGWRARAAEREAAAPPGEDVAEGGEKMPMQCFPLYTLLLALGNPTVDFLSLDVEVCFKQN